MFAHDARNHSLLYDLPTENRLMEPRRGRLSEFRACLFPLILTSLNDQGIGTDLSQIYSDFLCQKIYN